MHAGAVPALLAVLEAGKGGAGGLGVAHALRHRLVRAQHHGREGAGAGGLRVAANEGVVAHARVEDGVGRGQRRRGRGSGGGGCGAVLGQGSRREGQGRDGEAAEEAVAVGLGRGHHGVQGGREVSKWAGLAGLELELELELITTVRVSGLREG